MPDNAASFTSANAAVVSMLKERAIALETLLDADVLFYRGPLYRPCDGMIRQAMEARGEKRGKLAFLLETDGGSLEVVVRIVETVRHHYPDCVEFIIPDFAYSAGTVLALSGNEIHMDYFSVLGPTDPQDEVEGRPIPVLGYLDAYDDLMKKAQESEGICSAEMAIILQFDQARLRMYRHSREMATDLLKDWLPKYKFRDWKETETKREPVTPEKREERAKEIAEKLSETKKWRSHGRGISKTVLDREVKLKVKDFGEDAELSPAIRSYNDLLLDFAGRVNLYAFVHTPSGFTLPYGVM
jgi:hypothetical protein